MTCVASRMHGKGGTTDVFCHLLVVTPLFAIRAQYDREGHSTQTIANNVNDGVYLNTTCHKRNKLSWTKERVFYPLSAGASLDSLVSKFIIITARANIGISWLTFLEDVPLLQTTQCRQPRRTLRTRLQPLFTTSGEVKHFTSIEIAPGQF